MCGVYTMSIFNFGVTRGSNEKPTESPYKAGDKIERIDITPAMAEDMLRFNGKNPRSRIDPKRVKIYAGFMIGNEWTRDISSICFDVDGYLVNGQHRLSAVVLSQKTIRFNVEFGCNENDVKHMDSGQKRSVAQNLRKGNPETAVARILCRFSNILQLGHPINILKIEKVLNYLEPHWLKYQSCGGSKLSMVEVASILFCLARSEKTNEFGTTDEILSLVKNYRNGQRSPMQNKWRESVAENNQGDKNKFDNIMRGIECFNPLNLNHHKNRLPSKSKDLAFYSNYFNAMIRGGI